MEKNSPPAQKTIRFKAYPKREQAMGYPTEIIKLNTKGPRLVHDMLLDYRCTLYHLDSIRRKSIHKPLEKLKLINTLYLELSEADIENDMILQNLSQKIKFLSSLRVLKLQLPEANWISLKGVEHLASALAQMKLLEKLIMNFHFAEWVTDETLHLLYKSLKKHKNLKSLDLNIPHCPNITEKSFKHLASALKYPPQSLREFSLDLAGLDLTEGNALDFLASGLTNLTDLQKLQICFYGAEISSAEKFSSFLSSIKYLKSLRMLDLNFSIISINAFTLKCLANSFKSLTHLHTLSLSFGYCPTFTFQEMGVLAQCLKSIAPSLKNLTLDFSSSSNTNDQALNKLSAGLKTLTNLSEIHLRCEKCPNIGNPGVESITYELGNLPNLHYVALAFRDCRPIRDVYYNGLKMKKNIKNLSWRY